MSAPAKEKRLSKKALVRAWANWAFWSHACYNWVRMQGIGFAHSMVPITKELYKDDPEGRKEVMKRQMEFFNTEPEIGMVTHGLAAAMEEQKANGKEITGEMITSVKTSLMGPLAGLGDTFFQGILVPVTLAIFIDMTLNGMIAAPILYALVITGISAAISYGIFMYSYMKGNEAVLNLISSGVLDKVLKGANIMGCTVMGALIASYVGLKCGIVINAAGSEFNIQTGFFDAVLPGVLPLLLTLGCYKLLSKGLSTGKVILLIVVVGAIGNLLGILA
jgi:D-glucosaminate-specific PTS system IID component